MDLEPTLDALAPRLLRYCLGLTGRAAVAEDAAQEALLALVSRWRLHGPPDDAGAFVFTVARRRLRRNLWRDRLLQPIETLTERADHAPDPEALFLTGSTFATTLAALRKLSGRDREALLLVAAGELDGAQAAQVLGIGRSALKMRVHRARQRLSRLLEDRHAKPREA